MRRGPGGDYSAIAFEPGWFRVITSDYDRVAGSAEPATFEQLRESLVRLAGTDFGMRKPRWVSRFNDAARQADRYRQGRKCCWRATRRTSTSRPVGRGLNMGVQDAVNLGWKLASVVRGRAPGEPAGQLSRRAPPGRGAGAAQHPGAVGAGPARTADGRAARGVRRAAGVRRREPSPARDAHRAGRPVPGGLRPSAGGPPGAGRGPRDGRRRHPGPRTAARRASGAARSARRGASAAVAAGWADRVDVVEARSEADHWSVPVIGEVLAPAALLVRPDGHVAWAAAPTARPAAPPCAPPSPPGSVRRPGGERLTPP